MKRLFNHDLVMQVREFMERFDVYQIAAKMKLDVYTVQAIIDFINGVTQCMGALDFMWNAHQSGQISDLVEEIDRLKERVEILEGWIRYYGKCKAG